MSNAQISSCQADLRSDLLFHKLTQVASECQHIRIAPKPLSQSKNSIFIDVIARLAWQCLKPINGGAVSCSRPCEPCLEVIVKQSSVSAKELDRDLFVFIHVTTKDPKIVLLCDPTSDDEKEQLLIGPLSLVATAEERDWDTAAFRVTSKIKLKPVCALQGDEVHGRIQVSVIGRFNPATPKNFKLSEEKSCILAGVFCSRSLPTTSVNNMPVEASKVRGELGKLQDILNQYLDPPAVAKYHKELAWERIKILPISVQENVLKILSTAPMSPLERAESVLKVVNRAEQDRKGTG
jgi:hypothetical protein